MGTTEYAAGQTYDLPLSELRLAKRNPRKGNVGAVAASLLAHGQYKPIVANLGTHTGRRLEVIKGNHTLKAIRQLARKRPDDERWATVKVHLVDVDDDQATKILLADNQTSARGGYDNDELAGMLHGLDDLAGTGYTFEDLDAFHVDPVDIPPEAYDDPDPEDLPPAPSGRGAPVISYSIVFDTVAQKTQWLDFVNWLKRQYPDLTASERLEAYIEKLAELEGERSE